MIYTPETFQKAIDAKLAKLNTANLIYPIATEVHDMMVTRIFDEGKSGNGQSIGKYSTKPAYYTQKQFHGSGFKPQGKNSLNVNGKRKSGSDKLGNGKERKSMYLIGGYKQLRQIQGDETGFVNLTYSAKLRKEFATKLAINKDTVVFKLSDTLNKNKVDGLTEKYGPDIFKHSKEEREFFRKETQKALIKYFNT